MAAAHTHPIQKSWCKFKIEHFFFFRSQINLHLHDCPEKAVECQVPGCKRVIKRKDTASHLVESAVSHFRLQSGEIQRLRREIHEKVIFNSWML